MIFCENEMPLKYIEMNLFKIIHMCEHIINTTCVISVGVSMSLYKSVLLISPNVKTHGFCQLQWSISA